jgi:hypothetical protein
MHQLIKMRKIIPYLILLIFIGCKNKEERLVKIYPHPQDEYYFYPKSLPKDFAIKADIWYGDKYIYNSKDSVLIKNYDWDKYCTIKLALTHSDKAAIYYALKYIDILSYPHYYNGDERCQPCPCYDCTFTFDGISKEIIWVQSGASLERPKKLENLFLLCDSIIRHKEEYIKTPPDLRHYE